MRVHEKIAKMEPEYLVAVFIPDVSITSKRFVVLYFKRKNRDEIFTCDIESYCPDSKEVVREKDIILSGFFWHICSW